MTRLFLDHNATTPIKPSVRDAMVDAMALGNPSSVHLEGRKAKAAIEHARTQLCTALDAPETGCIFTSGGTEAINMALYGLSHREKEPIRHFLVGAVEHDAMMKTSQMLAEQGVINRQIVPVTSTGQYDFNWLETALENRTSDDGPFLVCMMLANNENGVIQNITAIAPKIFQKGGFLLVDATQALGKVPVSFSQLQADLMIVSAHKVGGPKGVGALLTKPGIPLAPLIHGGGQEMSRRVGTENVIGIVGFGAAAAALDVDAMQKLADQREAIIEGLKAADIKGLKIWGEAAPQRLPNTLCFSAPGFASELQVMRMDLAGIAISAGSACSSGKVKASHVVTALGASEEEAAATVRISLGWDTPPDAAARFLEAWQAAYGAVRQKIKLQEPA